jgi:hypothetical protein
MRVASHIEFSQLILSITLDTTTLDHDRLLSVWRWKQIQVSPTSIHFMKASLGTALYKIMHKIWVQIVLKTFPHQGDKKNGRGDETKMPQCKICRKHFSSL